MSSEIHDPPSLEILIGTQSTVEIMVLGEQENIPVQISKMEEKTGQR